MDPVIELVTAIIEWPLLDEVAALVGIAGAVIAFLRWGLRPLVGALRRRRKPKGRLLHNVPALPPHYLPRPDDLKAVKALLLGERGAVAVSGVQRAGAVQGMGGVGKSVLAAAVAREGAVQERFPDGVFWVVLGQDPSRLLQTLTTLIEMLGGDWQGLTGVTQARGRLEMALAAKTCLVIVDDVWRLADIQAFRVTDTPSRLLLTTRDAGIVQQMGAAGHSVDQLDLDESLELLAINAGIERMNLPRPIADEVAEECGHLPLALTLAGATIKGEGDRWPQVLQALRAADLEQLRAVFPDYPYPHVFAAIGASVDALGEDAERYIDLAVFQEDTPIPIAALKVLWDKRGLQGLAVIRLVDVFVERSLADRNDEGCLTLHDLQGDFVRKRAGDLSTRHALMCDNYRDICSDDWASGPNDGYFFQQLPWHLANARDWGNLRALLFDFCWLQKKLSVTGVNAVLRDFALVPEDEETQSLADAILYSAHAFVGRPTQLAAQLWGRLTLDTGPSVADLLSACRARGSRPMILPLRATLMPPGTGEIRRFDGHEGAVVTVSVMADGRRAVSGSDDGTVRLWDLETGEEMYRFDGHAGGVTAVAMTADGRRAVSGSFDRTVRLWDLESGREIRCFEGHRGGITAIAVTADGRRAVSGSFDRSVRLWNLESFGEISYFEGHTRFVRAVAVTADGRRAVTGSSDRTIRLWDLEKAEEICRLGVDEVHVWQRMWDRINGDFFFFEAQAGWIRALALTVDGRQAVSSSSDGTVRVLDLDNGQEIRRFEGHEGTVTAVAVSADGQYVVSGSFDQTVRLWEFESGNEVCRFAGHEDFVLAVAVTADGRRAVSGSSDGTLRLWDRESGGGIQRLEGHKHAVRALAVSADARRAVFSSDDGTVRLWDLENGKEIHSLKNHDDCVRAAALMPDGRHAVLGSDDGAVRLWNLESNLEVLTLEGHKRSVRAVTMTADGRRAVSGSADRTVRLWDLENGTEIHRFEGHQDFVLTVAVTADGRRAISASSDHTVRLWDVGRGQEIRRLVRRNSFALSIAVTSDGRHAVLGSVDGIVRLWDLESGEEIHRFVGHKLWVTAVAVTADGLRAVSGSADRTIRLWDLESGRELARLDIDVAITSCALAADSHRIAAGDSRGQIHVLEILE